MPVNSNDFSAFDEALKKSEPSVPQKEDDFSAFDQALKKKVEEPSRASSKEPSGGVSVFGTYTPPKEKEFLPGVPVPKEKPVDQKPIPLNINLINNYQNAQIKNKLADDNYNIINQKNTSEGFFNNLGTEIKEVFNPNIRDEQKANIANAQQKKNEASQNAKAAQEKLAPEIKKITDRVESEFQKYTMKSTTGMTVVDPRKVNDYVNKIARNIGIPEDTYFTKLLYNEISAVAANKIIEPDVLKETEKIYKQQTGRTLSEDLKNNTVVIENEKIQFNKAQNDIASQIKVDTTNKVTQLKDLYVQKSNEIKDSIKPFQDLVDTYSDLIKDGKFIGTQEQYNQYQLAYNQLNQSINQKQPEFQRLSQQFIDEQNLINTKANARYRRQVEEIERVYENKIKDKYAAAQSALQKKMSEIYSKAYKNVLNRNNEYKKLINDVSGNFIQSGVKGFLSALGGSISGLSSHFNIKGGEVFGDFIEGKFDIGRDEINSFIDLLDPQKLSKSIGQLGGGMAIPMIGTALSVAGARGAGAGVFTQMAISGALSWMGETADIAGRMKKDVFAKTGDMTEAENAAGEVIKGQRTSMPLYALEGLPFMGNLVKLGKNMVTRAVIGGAAEFVPELITEYKQNIEEEAIKETGDYRNALEFHSLDRLKNTALQIAPVIALGAGGQLMAVDEKTKQKQLIDKAAKAFALKVKFSELAPTQRDQFLFDVVQRNGAPFASAYLLANYTSGNIDKATFDNMSKTLVNSTNLITKSKELGLTPADQKIFTAFTFQYDKTKAAVESEQDPIIKKALEAKLSDYENQLKSITTNKKADYVVLTYPNNEQYVFTYAEAEEALNDSDFSNALGSGDIKLDIFGENKRLSDRVAQVKEQKETELKAIEELKSTTEKNKRTEVENKYNVTIEDNVGDIGVEVIAGEDVTAENLEAAKQELRDSGIKIRGDVAKEVAEPKVEVPVAEEKPTEALKDVESTTKGLEKSLREGGEIDEDGYAYYNQEKISPIANAFTDKMKQDFNRIVQKEELKTAEQFISEAYHADKAAGKETELTKAVEDLLGKKVGEEVTPKAEAELPPTPEKATPKVEEEITPKEAKEGDTVELPSQVKGGLPRTMIFSEGEWKQQVGGNITNVGENVKQQAQAAFEETKVEVTPEVKPTEVKAEIPEVQKTKPQQIGEGLLNYLGVAPEAKEGEVKFSKTTGEPQVLTPKEDKESQIVDQMNSMNLVNNGIDLSSPSTTKEKIGISELNSRLDNPLNTVKWDDFEGMPFTFTISDQLRTGDIKNPNTGEVVTDLKGGIGFNGTKGNENNAWANTTKEEAEAMLQRAKDVYENNKPLFEKLWKEGKLPDGHIPMAVVKMAETSILSNEAVFRVGIQNIETLPKANRKKAVSELAKSMKAKIDTESASLKRGVDKNGKPYTENTVKLKKKAINQYQKILDSIKENKYEDIVDVLKDKDNFSLPEKALIANEVFYGSPTPIGGKEIDISRSRPSTPVSKVLIGNKNPALINLGKITDLLTEPSMKNVPNMHIVSIVGVDVKNPNVNKINHTNYPYGVKGKSIGVLESPVHMKDAFGEAYGSALGQVVKNEAANASVSIKNALTQGIPVQSGLPNRVFKSAIAKGQLDAVDKLAGFLRQAFPNTTFFTSKEAWDAAMSNPSIKKKLKDGDVVYAFTTDGNIFINPELKTTKATLHETGHIWMGFVKENNPQLHGKGLDLVTGTKEHQKAIAEYGDTELAREEALMELMSTKGDTILNASQRAQFKEWLLSVYKYIADNFKSLMGLSTKEIENLTLDKFLEGMLADVLSGKELTTKKVKGEVKFSLKSQKSQIKDYIDNQRKAGESDADIRAGIESVANKLGLTKEDIDSLMKGEVEPEVPTAKVEPTKVEKVEFGEGEQAEANKKEFNNLTSTIPNTGEVTKYLSGETIKKYEGEEARNEQEVFAQQLREALVRGVDIVNKGREIFGEDYVQKLLDYVETENLPPANKALIYVSLENEVAKQKIENPSKVQQLEKLQDLVRAKSQAFLRSSALAINFGRLRKLAEVGYDISRLTNDFFSSKQMEQKRTIEKAIEATPDDINQQAEELRRKIEEGIQEEVAKIYESLSKEKKSYADKAISALDKIQQKLRNKTYADFTGMTALIDAGITTIKAAIKAGVKVADAIELGINKIKESYQEKTGESWKKEDEFRKDITEAFKSEGITEPKKEMSKSEFNRLEKEILELDRQIQKGEKDKFDKKKSKESDELDRLRKEKEEKQAILEALDPTPKIFIENALIEQGFGRQINVKTKEGVEKRWVLDWKKLAGEEGSIDNIRQRVESALKDKGYTEEQILRMKDAFVEEYNNLRASIIEKSMNEIAAKNKQTVTPEQKAAVKKLAEMYNYGLFDKDPAEYELAIAKTLGLSIASQNGIKKAMEMGESMSNMFNVNYEGRPLTESQLRTAIQVIEEKMRAILYSESMKEGNVFFKLSNLTKIYMDMSQRMLLNTVKQGFENPFSGLLERFYSSIGYSGKIPSELNSQQRKLARDIYKEMVLQKGIGYGNVGTAFVAKGNIDAYIGKMSDHQLVNGIISMGMGKPILDAVDSAFKAKITQQKFTYNLIKILTQDRKINGKVEKGMSLDEAKKYVAEKISGQSFENAKETARKIIENVNKNAGEKIFNDSEQFVNRLATDIVNASLVNGEKITEEMVTVAYNSAYKAAGRGLGHVANNFISDAVSTVSGKIESKINDAIKEKNYTKAARLNFYSIFYRNIANPFVGGGTNWLVLKAEKSGLGLFSGLYSLIGKEKKPDLTTESGLKELENSLYEEMKIRDQFIRGAIGGAVTALTYLLIKGTDTDDKFEEWLKKNEWTKKYTNIITPEVALALMASKSEKSYKKYLESLFNKNEAFDKMAMAIKATTYLAVGKKEEGYGKLGELVGGSVGAPIPWRLVRDGQQIYVGATGGKPYRVDPKPSKSFSTGFLKGGFIDYLGYAPKDVDLVFGEKMGEPGVKMLVDNELGLPDIPKIDKIKVNKDDRHPEGVMTKAEGEEYIKLWSGNLIKNLNSVANLLKEEEIKPTAEQWEELKSDATSDATEKTHYEMIKAKKYKRDELKTKEELKFKEKIAKTLGRTKREKIEKK